MESLRSRAALRGFEVVGVATTTTDLGSLDREHNGSDDLVIVYPWNYNVWKQLWDLTCLTSDNLRAARLDECKDYLRTLISDVISRLESRLLLVQGCSGPPILPPSRLDFRSPVSYGRILFELNETICELIRGIPHAFVVDEDRIFANYGRTRACETESVFFDYAASVHDRNTNSSILRAGPLNAIADEYLNIYEMATNYQKVKCIVIDLDGTLWPGEIANDLLSASVLDIAVSPFGGIHEALRILKTRGIMLATCSKNVPGPTLQTWQELCKAAEELGLQHLLAPSDAVLHCINWEDKVRNLANICHTLSVVPENMLFIDDNCVERDAILNEFPDITVLSPLDRSTRSFLLDSPRCQSITCTLESMQRSETMVAQLELRRELASTHDRAALLKELEIQLTIAQLCREAPLARVVELAGRTNQFNTTQIRYTFESLGRLLQLHNTRVYTLHVRDRNAQYGLVGFCVIVDSRIVNAAISCRVLPLAVEIPFMASVLNILCQDESAISADLNFTEFNTPCHKLYEKLGFSKDVDGTWHLHHRKHAVQYEAAIYSVVFPNSDAAVDHRIPLGPMLDKV